MVQVTGPAGQEPPVRVRRRSGRRLRARCWSATATTRRGRRGPRTPRRSRTHTSVASSPSSEDHPLRLFFVLSFLAARQHALHHHALLRPRRADPRRGGGARAAGRGRAHPRCPTSRPTPMPIRLAGHSYFEELLAAGVRIYEYQPTMMHSQDGGGGRPVVGGRLRQHGHPLEGAEPGERARHPRRRVRGRAPGGIPGRPREVEGDHAPGMAAPRAYGQRVKERAAVVFAEQY